MGEMKLGSFFLHRVWMSLPILLGLTLLSFLLGVIAPSDPALVLLTLDGQSEPSAAELWAMQEKLGLHDPLIVQFGHWFFQICRGDFGVSYITGKPVWDSLWEFFPATLYLGLLAMLIVAVVAIVLGCLAALHVHSWIDRSIRIAVIVLSAVPGFWLAILAIHYFAEEWRLLPTSGYGSFEQMIMPAVVLAAGSLATMVRLQRSSLLEQLEAPFVLTERSQGLSTGRILWRHIFPNSLMPVVTLLGTYMIAMLGGAIIIEAIFSLPGLGSFVLNGIRGRDYPVIQGYVLFIGVIVVVLNLLIDVSYFYLHPQSREEE